MMHSAGEVPNNKQVVELLVRYGALSRIRSYGTRQHGSLSMRCFSPMRVGCLRLRRAFGKGGSRRPWRGASCVGGSNPLPCRGRGLRFSFGGRS